MFTILVIVMLSAITLSLFGRQGREIKAHAIIHKTVAHARRVHRRTPRRVGVALAVIAFGGLALALGLLLDYRVLADRDDRTVSTPSQSSGPGPGWRTGQGGILPPSGFSGRAIVRFQDGASADGFAVVAHGQFKRLGWRVTGQDAAYCFLDVELVGQAERRGRDEDGYAHTATVLGEGWHEARIHMWCPEGHANARFTIATQPVNAHGYPEGGTQWTEAGDAEIRHR